MNSKCSLINLTTVIDFPRNFLIVHSTTNNSRKFFFFFGVVNHNSKKQIKRRGKQDSKQFCLLDCKENTREAYGNNFSFPRVASMQYNDHAIVYSTAGTLEMVLLTS